MLKTVLSFVILDNPLYGTRLDCNFWVFIVPCFGLVLAFFAGHFTSLLSKDRDRMLAVFLVSLVCRVCGVSSGFFFRVTDIMGGA